MSIKHIIFDTDGTLTNNQIIYGNIVEMTNKTVIRQLG